MKEIKFQVIDELFRSAMSAPYESAAQAILDAGTYDDFKAAFKRDEKGDMRLYSSSGRIGNNPRTPTERETLLQYSSLPNDEEAIADLSLKIVADQYAIQSSHGYIKIQTLEFENGVLQSIDGTPVHSILRHARQDFVSDESIMRGFVGRGIPFNANAENTQQRPKL